MTAPFPISQKKCLDVGFSYGKDSIGVADTGSENVGEKKGREGNARAVFSAENGSRKNVGAGPAKEEINENREKSDNLD